MTIPPLTLTLPVPSAAALVYRVPISWEGPKLPWKLLHAVLTLTAFILVVLGLVAVFEFHNKKEIASMYSLHSWLGLATVLLFSSQVSRSLRLAKPGQTFSPNSPAFSVQHWPTRCF